MKLFHKKLKKRLPLVKIRILKMFELNCQWPVSLLMFRNLSAGGEYIVWQLLIRNIGFLCKKNFYNPLTQLIFPSGLTQKKSRDISYDSCYLAYVCHLSYSFGCCKTKSNNFYCNVTCQDQISLGELNFHPPNICQFWGTTALFRPVKGAQKSA